MEKERCKARTQKRHRCLNDAMPGSEYCQKHSGGWSPPYSEPRQPRSFRWLQILVIVVVVLWVIPKIPYLLGSNNETGIGYRVDSYRSGSSTGGSQRPARTVPELSDEERLEQEEAASAAFAAAAALADEAFDRDGDYVSADLDSFNGIAENSGGLLPLRFTAGASTSPFVVSVSAPSSSGDSWGMAVWSPLRCRMMTKHPEHGTYQAELNSDSTASCSGMLARRDYDLQAGWAGDRPGAPPAVWTHRPADSDPGAPYSPVDQAELVEAGDGIAALTLKVGTDHADDALARDGDYTGATVTAINDALGDPGPFLALSFSEDDSTSPVGASIGTPSSSDGVWAIAVWSPSGCLLVAKDPAHGTFNAVLPPGLSERCSGTWARDDYSKTTGAEGDRADTPVLRWSQQTSDTAPATTAAITQE